MVQNEAAVSDSVIAEDGGRAPPQTDEMILAICSRSHSRESSSKIALCNAVTLALPIKASQMRRECKDASTIEA